MPALPIAELMLGLAAVAAARSLLSGRAGRTRRRPAACKLPTRRAGSSPYPSQRLESSILRWFYLA